MKIGNEEYKLFLIDTNIIREILNNSNGAGRGFFLKMFNSETKYAPCFSIYNVIELMPYTDIFEDFLTLFSKIPCLMFYTAKQIIYAEYEAYENNRSLEIDNKLANAFTPLINNESYNLKRFIGVLQNNFTLMEVIQNENDELLEISFEWEKQRTIMKNLNSNITDRNYLENEEKSVIKDIINWGIDPIDGINIEKFPALRIMLYSQFSRVHLTNKKIKPNDVMDILISTIIPYVDAVLTENFQAEVYKKGKKYIPQLKELKIHTLKDIRK